MSVAGGPRPVLSVTGLTTEIARGADRIAPVRDVTLDISAGETVCVVGESGSGKSLLGLSVMQVLPAGAQIVSGSVRLEGEELIGASEHRLREIRGRRIAMVLQDPMTAFDPLLTIGQQIDEAVRAHSPVSRTLARARTLSALEQVRLPDPVRVARTLPSQLSGGMNQRALIAMALATDPLVLIADEPTTALDATVQAQVLELLAELQASIGLALLLITHDMGVAAMIGHRVAVMYAGRLVESGPIRPLFRRARHPYTVGLMAAARDEGRQDGHRATIPGSPPALGQLPPGCSFAPRCGFVRAGCAVAPPELRTFEELEAACILRDEERPWLNTSTSAHG